MSGIWYFSSSGCWMAFRCPSDAFQDCDHNRMARLKITVVQLLIEKHEVKIAKASGCGMYLMKNNTCGTCSKISAGRFYCYYRGHMEFGKANFIFIYVATSSYWRQNTSICSVRGFRLCGVGALWDANNRRRLGHKPRLNQLLARLMFSTDFPMF